MAHPQSAEDAPGFPGIVHQAADILFQVGVGAAVGLVTKNPYVTIATSKLAPHLADAYESWVLDTFGTPYGGVSSYPSSSAVTSTTGHSVRTPAKKQISSTSQSYSRRRYYYGKKRKHYRY